MASCSQRTAQSSRRRSKEKAPVEAGARVKGRRGSSGTNGGSASPHRIPAPRRGSSHRRPVRGAVAWKSQDVLGALKRVDVEDPVPVPFAEGGLQRDRTQDRGAARRRIGREQGVS